MKLDAVTNFALCEVSTGYDDNDTSIVLATGHGAFLPAPAVDGEFNLVWWDASSYPISSEDPNREIVRVTARTSDTLTVIRGYEGTTGSNKNTAGKTYKMMLAFTKHVHDQIVRNIPRLVSITSSATPTCDTDATDYFRITDLATNITNMSTNFTGTPRERQRIVVEIYGNNSYTINWGTSFADAGGGIPNITPAGKKLTVTFIWFSEWSKWGCVSTIVEF